MGYTYPVYLKMSRIHCVSSVSKLAATAVAGAAARRVSAAGAGAGAGAGARGAGAAAASAIANSQSAVRPRLAVPDPGSFGLSVCFRTAKMGP